MSYNPSVKVYYISESDGGPNENNRLVPAPKISIGQEMIYANDTVIGYSFIININGYATSLDLRNVVPGTTYDFDDTVGAIDKFKDIITSNGGIFLVTDNNGKEILKATGGTLRSVNIDQSDNRWVNYAPYTAEIEFNELWLGDCGGLVDKTCGLIFDGLTESPYLLDMKKYRVKSFSDSVSFELSDDTMYNSFTLGSLGIHNQHFNITYKIDAVGKHYFNKENFQLMPAWEQAKRFIQHKLIDQIKNRLTSTFMQRASDGCDPLTDLASLYSPGIPGLISDINTSNFSIYNETITCEASESEGSFSATYNAIIKRKNTGTESAVLHTFSKASNTTDDGQTRNVNITINGNIQGLVETGLIRTPNILELPNNGSIFAYNDNSTNSRYSKALSAFNNIATKEDLKDNIKTFFTITNEALGVTGNCISPSGLAPPASHNITHSYIEGSIGYETTYTTERACSPSGTGFTNVNVSVEDSVDIIAEFVIPGRTKGPILQKIGAKTPRKVNINIDGTLDKKCCIDFSNLYDNACNGLPLPSGIPSATIDGMKLTQDQFVSNPLDGSYSISRAYICCEG
jgi:hypothetical protein